MFRRWRRMKGARLIAIFRPISRFISEIIQEALLSQRGRAMLRVCL